ncbi:hypothetical protein ACLEJQ_12275 [Pseudomonas sp. SMV71]|uniref:hypothetical protein n=1 Tax=Pseudomonas sp. SMV71 TaxID=3390195 RepID=UPI003F8766CB
MSVMNKVDAKQSREVDFKELNDRERMLVKKFRQLDEVSQKDILRFLNVLLRL